LLRTKKSRGKVAGTQRIAVVDLIQRKPRKARGTIRQVCGTNKTIWHMAYGICNNGEELQAGEMKGRFRQGQATRKGVTQPGWYLNEIRR
jgi:hypothetical protein